MTTAWATALQKGDTGGSGTTGPTAPAGLDTWEVPGGRLTLVSGNPIPTTDVVTTSAVTIYYTPYLSSQISLYDGSKWVVGTFTEFSLSLSGLTTAQPYDIFAYLVGSTYTLEAIAWTNTTTRATALVRQDGILVKSGTLTKRFVGTLQMQATSQCEDSVTRRYVYNQYNKVRRQLRVVEATATWNYTTATWRSANNSTTNRVAVVNGSVSGTAELLVHLDLFAMSLNASAAGGGGLAGTGCIRIVAFGVDVTNAPFASSPYSMVRPDQTCFGMQTSMVAVLDHLPDVGLHFYQWLENAQAVGTATWTGTGSTTASGGVCGIDGHVLI